MVTNMLYYFLRINFQGWKCQVKGVNAFLDFWIYSKTSLQKLITTRFLASVHEWSLLHTYRNAKSCLLSPSFPLPYPLTLPYIFVLFIAFYLLILIPLHSIRFYFPHLWPNFELPIAVRSCQLKKKFHFLDCYLYGNYPFSIQTV